MDEVHERYLQAEGLVIAKQLLYEAPKVPRSNDFRRKSYRYQESRRLSGQPSKDTTEATKLLKEILYEAF